MAFMFYTTREDYSLYELFNITNNDDLDQPREELGGMSIGDFETLANSGGLSFPGTCIYCEDLEELAWTVDSMLREIFEIECEWTTAFYQKKSDGIYLAIKIFDVYAIFDCDCGGYGWGTTLSYFEKANKIEMSEKWEELV